MMYHIWELGGSRPYCDRVLVESSGGFPRAPRSAVAAVKALRHTGSATRVTAWDLIHLTGDQRLLTFDKIEASVRGWHAQRYLLAAPWFLFHGRGRQIGAKYRCSWLQTRWRADPGERLIHAATMVAGRGIPGASEFSPLQRFARRMLARRLEWVALSAIFAAGPRRFGDDRTIKKGAAPTTTISQLGK